MNYRDHGEICGIANIGNSCYISSALQVILHCYDAMTTIISSSGPTGPTYQMFRQFAHDYWTHPNVVMTPINLKHTIAQRATQFRGADQGDAQEFLSVLIDELYEMSTRRVRITATGTPQTEEDQLMMRVIEAWAEQFQNKYSDIVPLFYNLNCNRFLCPECKHVKDRYETANMVQISLPSDDSSATLQQLINNIRNPEHLVDALSTCDNCNQQIHYWHELRYVCLPKYVFFHIKRFIYPHKKLNKVEIQEGDTVSMSAATVGYEQHFAEYRVRGAVIHMGNMDNGHYISIWKTRSDQWILFDDDKIRRIPDELARLMISDNGYIIVGERITSPPYRRT
jgi:ubiquitin C-terminal hydrolase